MECNVKGIQCLICGLIEAVFRHLHVGTEESEEKPQSQNIRSLGQELNQGPPEHVQE
jgi:hypothetical protein